MRIPTQRECFRLIAEMRMLDHIVAHSIQVCRVATLLVDQLNACRLEINRELVRASALLHDITKTRSLTTGENHAATGCEYVSQRGYPEVGEVVGQHVQLKAAPIDATPLAAEIVNYADKRVLHDRVVPLEQRMRYILERYGCKAEFRERWQRLWSDYVTMETRIFRGLRIAPRDLPAFLDGGGLAADIAAYRKILARTERPPENLTCEETAP
ncbi:MAG: HDIG domain-containing protein [Desulfobacteraceae bacterium]|jgi:putative nucleotidyltransferase with HDIG domain|nr:HDIG domain-containing protein [Desulfobacteraceae bacterium]